MSIAGRVKEKNSENGAQNHGHEEGPQFANRTGHVIVVVLLGLKSAKDFVPQTSLAVALVIFGAERLRGSAVKMLCT